MIFLFNATQENNMSNVAMMPPRVNGIGSSRAGFNQAHSLKTLGFGQLRPVEMNLFGAFRCVQLVAGDLLLPRKFLVNEFAGDTESSTRCMGDGLCSTQSNIARCIRTSGKQHFTVAVQHRERCTDV